jgi:hypothetical protein
MPALGFSLLLIAVGAILTWAVDATVTGVDIAAVGVILMIDGLVGVVMSMAFWTSFSPWAEQAPIGRRNVYRERSGSDVVVEDDRPDTVIVHDQGRRGTRI